MVNHRTTKRRRLEYVYIPEDKVGKHHSGVDEILVQRIDASGDVYNLIAHSRSALFHKSKDLGGTWKKGKYAMHISENPNRDFKIMRSLGYVPYSSSNMLPDPFATR